MDISSNNSDYSFSVVFSATESVRREIQSRFLSLVKDIEASVSHSKRSKTYQMSFDLMTWV